MAGAPPQVSAEPARLKPSRSWYAIALAILLVSWIGAGVLFAVALSNLSRPVADFASGERGEVTLEERAPRS